MKQGIHPKYFPETKVVCSCGNSWTVGSTVPQIRTDVCSACHPFFTGEQRIVDAEGQVDRFFQRLERREQIQAALEAQRQAAIAENISIDEIDLNSRALKILKDEGIQTISDLMARLDQGEATLLRIPGFGQKSLIDVRKWLRAEGYIS